MADTKEIIQAIAEHLGVSPEDLDLQASLKDDLGMGPIELNDLLNSLLKRFDITVLPEELEDLETVNDLIVLVEDNLLD